jgi:hypothetical protein
MGGISLVQRVKGGWEVSWIENGRFWLFRTKGNNGRLMMKFTEFVYISCQQSCREDVGEISPSDLSKPERR